MVGGLEANGLVEGPVTKGLVEILCPSLTVPRSPKEEPFCCSVTEACGGKGAGEKVPPKAPLGGPDGGKPGVAPLTPKLSPVARPLGWKGLVEGGRGWAAGVVKGLVKAPKPGSEADGSGGTGPATPKMLLGSPPAAGPGPRRPLMLARLPGWLVGPRDEAPNGLAWLPPGQEGRPGGAGGRRGRRGSGVTTGSFGL